MAKVTQLNTNGCWVLPSLPTPNSLSDGNWDGFWYILEKRTIIVLYFCFCCSGLPFHHPLFCWSPFSSLPAVTNTSVIYLNLNFAWEKCNIFSFFLLYYPSFLSFFPHRQTPPLHTPSVFMPYVNPVFQTQHTGSRACPLINSFL